MEKVAVITRTKDRTLFLSRAINSVSKQTYSNYVHAIINDGGDEMAINNIVDSQPKKIKSKIKIFHRREASLGPDTILNESIDKLESEYIAILDDDDTWHEDFLLLTTEYLDNNKNIAGVVVRTNLVLEKKQKNSIRIIKSKRLFPDMEAISLYKQFKENQLMTNAFVFRRNAYEKVGKYDDTLPVVADWEFGIRFLQNYEVGFLNPGFALANYHHRMDKKDNSFAKHSHRKYVTLVANNYLRKDLKKGILGAGYIINDLKYREDSRNEFIKKFIPKIIIKAIKGK